MGNYGSTITRSLKVPHTALASVALMTALLSIVALQPAEAGFRYVGPQAVANSPMVMPGTPAPSNLMPQGAQTAASAGTVQGFANQVPLTVALRQVLPRGTAFRINNDVEPTTPVSWKGGRPWQQTVDDMLASAGLQASYTSNGVTVKRGAIMMDSAPAVMPASTPVALTPPMETSAMGGGMAAPAYAAANDTMQPLDVPAAPVAEAYTPPVIEPAPQAAMPQPQPYVAPATMGSASMMPNTNGTIGSVQEPVQAAPGTLPEGTIGEMPQQTVPGTDFGTVPAMQTSALNPLNPGPTDAQTSLAGAAAQVWEAHSGQTLHEVMKTWAERAGVELNWVAEYDYPIEASINFNGSFEEATRTLLGGFANASPQPIGRLHRNEQLGQQALIIETRGNNYDE